MLHITIILICSSVVFDIATGNKTSYGLYSWCCIDFWLGRCSNLFPNVMVVAHISLSESSQLIIQCTLCYSGTVLLNAAVSPKVTSFGKQPKHYKIIHDAAVCNIHMAVVYRY